MEGDRNFHALSDGVLSFMGNYAYKKLTRKMYGKEEKTKRRTEKFKKKHK